jgi:hypothetical protein
VKELQNKFSNGIQIGVTHLKRLTAQRKSGKLSALCAASTNVPQVLRELESVLRHTLDRQTTDFVLRDGFLRIFIFSAITSNDPIASSQTLLAHCVISASMSWKLEVDGRVRHGTYSTSSNSSDPFYDFKNLLNSNHLCRGVIINEPEYMGTFRSVNCELFPAHCTACETEQRQIRRAIQRNTGYNEVERIEKRTAYNSKTPIRGMSRPQLELRYRNLLAEFKRTSRRYKYLEKKYELLIEDENTNKDLKGNKH